MSLPSLSSRERALVVFLATLSAAAVVVDTAPAVVELPNLLQSPGLGHGFRTALDLITGVSLFAAGLWGWCRLRWLEREHERALDTARLPQATVQPPFNALDCAWMFFAGLILMAVGSAFQELRPGGLLLQADRAGMALALGGMVGFSVCERVSARAGWSTAWFVLGGGLIAVAADCGSNGASWPVLQFGGSTLLLALSWFRAIDSAVGFRLGWAASSLVLGGLCETLDGAIRSATGELVTGQNLNHLAILLVAIAALHALQSLGRKVLRHNPGAAAVTA